MTTPIRTIALLDCETTSLEPSTGHVVEVALALWSVEFHSLIRARSWLCAAPAEEVAKTEHVHGIPPALVAARGVPLEEVCKQVHAIVTKECDVFAAWNSAFDKAWFPPFVQNAKPWVCLCNDVEWVKRSSGRSLLAVAHAHGVQVGSLHRAMDDVQVCGRLLERCHELGADVSAMFDAAMVPKNRYVANVPMSRNDELKAANFRWSPERREWWADLTAEKAAALAFPVREVSL